MRTIWGRRCTVLAAGLMTIILGACRTTPITPPTVSTSTDDEAFDVVAFGSCARQDLPQPIWDRVLDEGADLFVLLGDNIYADHLDAEALAVEYGKLAAQPGFARVRERVPVLATWDDHDYGANDAGREHAAKATYEKAILDFFDVPADSPRRARPGIYGAQTFGRPGQRVQIILLDTRYFRGPLVRNPKGESSAHGRYVPNEDESVSLLGDAQWAWLAATLREPAEVRIIATSIQAVADDHGWEKWGNLPHERARLFRLIEETGAQGVMLISGDRHFGDLSVLPADHPLGVGYPLFDVTASGMTTGTVVDPRVERNRFRTGTPAGVFEVHFGVVRVDWAAAEPTVALEIHGLDGEALVREVVPLDRLRPEAR